MVVKAICKQFVFSHNLACAAGFNNNNNNNNNNDNNNNNNNNLAKFTIFLRIKLFVTYSHYFFIIYTGFMNMWTYNNCKCRIFTLFVFFIPVIIVI